jgi:hypothetical protein
MPERRGSAVTDARRPGEEGEEEDEDERGGEKRRRVGRLRTRGFGRRDLGRRVPGQGAYEDGFRTTHEEVSRRSI